MAATPVTLQFSSDKYEVFENVSPATIKVTRAGDPSVTVTVDYTTSDDTATKDVNYAESKGTLNFAPGETEKTFDVKVINNSLSGTQKTVNLALSNPTGGATIGSPANAVLTITPASLERFGSYVKKTISPRFITHALLGILLIGFIAGFGYLFTWRANSIAQCLAKDLRQVRQPPGTALPALKFPDALKAPQEEQGRLNEQLSEVRSRADHHFSVMKFYYAQYYSAILVAALTGAIAAMALILISKRGWDDVNEYVITIFLVMTALTVFYGAFPGVFQQPENIAANKELYNKYIDLENEVISFFATGEGMSENSRDKNETKPASNPSTPGNPKPKSGESKNQAPKEEKPFSAKQFIHYVDKALAEDDIVIGFDYTKRPIYTTTTFDTDTQNRK